MKAWSRAQHQHDRSDLGGLYHQQHQAETDLINSYLNSQQQYLHHHSSSGGRDTSSVPYGVPIPPPLVPEDEEVSPLPPPRSSSSNVQHSSRSRGKRSRHSGTSHQHENPAATSRSSHSQYPKYDLYPEYQTKYTDRSSRGDCHYTTKYGEDCHSSSKYQSSSKECSYNKTWPKHQYIDESSSRYTQDDHNIQYLQDLEENARLIQQQQQEHAVAKYAQVNKPRKSDKHCYDQQQHVSSSRQRDRSPQPDQQRGYTQEQIQAAKQAQEVVQCTKSDPGDQDHKYLESTSAESKERASRSTTSAKEDSENLVANPTDSSVAQQAGDAGAMETFKPASENAQSNKTLGEVQLQQEQIQYVDNDCCQVAVAPSTSASEVHNQLQQQPPQVQQAAISQSQQQQQQNMDQPPTATLKRSKGKATATASQFNTLERNMAEVAERDRRSAQQLQSTAATLERGTSRNFNSCDTCDAPLTPASLAGIDHRDLEQRPLTRSVTRATMYDEPPEKTSLFIVCSGLYGILLVVICIALLTAEIATNNIPLHYFESYFTFLYMAAILFLLYVFCYLLHEASCCGSGPPAPGSKGRNTYFHFQLYRYGIYTVNFNLKDSSHDMRRVSLDSWNLPRDALPDGSPIREKLATLRRPKKYKTSENDYSHGSFFLRVGGIAFGLGSLIYNGMELGNFFEIPWNSKCYQVLRGINPILQMIFTFSQLYFVFMNARLNIHRFKFLARFGLAHVVATDICVWIRTLVKECNKEISEYRAQLGHGVSEDYMIIEGYNSLSRRFGPDSFWVRGPYRAFMSLITPVDYYLGIGPNDISGPNITPAPAQALIAPTIEPLRHATASAFDNLVGEMNKNDDSNFVGDASGIGSSSSGVSFHSPIGAYDNNMQHSGVFHLTHNITCERNELMGNIDKYTSPYLYPFVIEYSFIAAAVLLAMWKNIGKNPRYWGEEDDHISVASKKMTHYAKTDCIGASKGLFFGLLTLICGLICLILFFVLIDHNNLQVSQLAVFLADSSHCVILIVSILATLLGFIRVQKMKFHGEDQSILGNGLLLISACGIFGYSAFNIIAGGLGVHSDMRNLLVFGTGIITIPQVLLQLLFITDAQRRRISTSSQNNNKPGRQVVTFLLLCNLTMWVLYTFEVQKVADSPIQLEFYGFYAWTVIQKVTLPLCIFFRFHSTVILAEIWKNCYKTKLFD